MVFVLALIIMHDLGFTPDRGTRSRWLRSRRSSHNSVEHGLKVPADPGHHAVRILQRWRRNLRLLRAAAVPVGTVGKPAGVRDRRPGRGDQSLAPQIVGGLLTPIDPSGCSARRTSALLISTAISVLMLVVIGLVDNFWLVVAADRDLGPGGRGQPSRSGRRT